MRSFVLSAFSAASLFVILPTVVGLIAPPHCIRLSEREYQIGISPRDIQQCGLRGGPSPEVNKLLRNLRV
jgi:hypothetical protein